jgi:hypothetical protein
VNTARAKQLQIRIEKQREIEFILAWKWESLQAVALFEAAEWLM